MYSVIEHVLGSIIQIPLRLGFPDLQNIICVHWLCRWLKVNKISAAVFQKFDILYLDC
jgi:hypothetical protein